MIAISNKDNRNAIKAHKKMTTYLKMTHHCPLLKSEVFKIERKYDELVKIYEKMITSKKTEVLGYRGLNGAKFKKSGLSPCFFYGEKLFNLNPNIEKLYETLTYITAKTRN